MMSRLLLLLAGLWLPLGCPAPSVVDAGIPDAGTSDAGETDAGQVDDDAGCMDNSEAAPADAGTGGGPGEGEGEGECLQVPLGAIAVQPDGAGVIPYEDCPNSEYLLGNCPNACCGSAPLEMEMIEAIWSVAAERGYRDQVEITRVVVSAPWVHVWVVYVIGWVRTVGRVSAMIDPTGHVDRLDIDPHMPAFLPGGVPPLSEVMEVMRTCSPDLQVNLCLVGMWYSGSCDGWQIRVAGYGGLEASTCEGGVLTLWDSCSPDAGMGEVSCSETSEPCCLME